jgi:ABC-type Fe3+-hydroxamate transport system substrate-binding protein
LLLLCALLGLIACDDATPRQDTNHRNAPRPLRIVSLSPGTTTVVSELGHAARLVAVSDDCELAQGLVLPRVGSLAAPDLATIAKLAPDVVLMLRQEQVEQSLAERGIEVMALSFDSIQLLLDGVREIGRRLADDAAGRRYESRLLDAIEAQQALGHDIAPQRVLLVFGPWPHWVAGAQSLVDKLLHHSHAFNAALGKGAKLYPLDDREVELAAPDVILVALAREDRQHRVLQRERRYWKRFDVPAIRNDRLVFIDSEPLLATGPNTLKAWPDLLRALRAEPLAVRND